MSLKNKVIVRLEKKVLVKVPECSDEKTEMTESIPYSFRKNFFFCNFASNLWREDILTLLCIKFVEGGYPYSALLFRQTNIIKY